MKGLQYTLRTETIERQSKNVTNLPPGENGPDMIDLDTDNVL